MFGFAVLRAVVEPASLGEELDRALAEGTRGAEPRYGSAGIGFRYVPMMTARTPLSLAQLDSFHESAATLLGGPTLVAQAKGTQYFGGADWHTDCTCGIGSVGFVSYLEPLSADTGALQVLAGSRRPEYGAAVARHLSGEPPDGDDGRRAAWMASLPSFAVETDPGDVIVFDEHLFHASFHGTDRRQWRVDFVRDPTGAHEEATVRAYFASMFPAEWDGGYDVDAFPHFDDAWRASGRPGVARLGELGVYDVAAAKEAFARARTRNAAGTGGPTPYP